MVERILEKVVNEMVPHLLVSISSFSIESKLDFSQAT